MTKKQKKMLVRILITAVMLIALKFIPITGIPQLLAYVAAYLVIGYDILKKAAKGIGNGRVFDENFLMAIATKEWKAKAGSSPALRFVLGAFVMIGALAFLGCPLRMVLRLAGGDLNAVVGLAGFAAGIFLGTIFIRKGFTLQRNYTTKTLDGTVLPAVMTGLLILFIAVPTLFKLCLLYTSDAADE